MPFSEGGPDPRGVQTSAVRVTEGPTQLSPHPPGARSPPAEAAGRSPPRALGVGSGALTPSRRRATSWSEQTGREPRGDA